MINVILKKMDKDKFNKIKEFVIAMLAIECKEDESYAQLLTEELYNIWD